MFMHTDELEEVNSFLLILGSFCSSLSWYPLVLNLLVFVEMSSGVFLAWGRLDHNLNNIAYIIYYVCVMLTHFKVKIKYETKFKMTLSISEICLFCTETKFMITRHNTHTQTHRHIYVSQYPCMHARILLNFCVHVSGHHPWVFLTV